MERTITTNQTANEKLADLKAKLKALPKEQIDRLAEIMDILSAWKQDRLSELQMLRKLNTYPDEDLRAATLIINTFAEQ